MAEVDAEGHLLNTEVFQIDDFTVNTPFETLVAQLEMAIHDWGLGKGTRNNNFQIKRDMSFRIEWDSKSVEITPNDSNSFTLTHYWPKNIPRSDVKQPEGSQVKTPNDSYFTDSLRLLARNEVDFIPGSIISSQFAILEFLLITSNVWPTDGPCDENQLNFVLSAVNVAVSNLECDIPIFVQYGNFAAHSYTGVSQNDAVRTDFLTSNIAHQLTRHSNVNGLKEIFSDRLNLTYSLNVSATVSFMADFILQEDSKSKSAEAEGYDGDYPPEFSFVGSGSYLSFGPVTDLVGAIGVSSLWQNMDFQRFSEDGSTCWSPFDAPNVYAFVDFNSGVQCALHQCLRTLMEASVSSKANLRILTVLEDAGYDEDSLGRTAFASLAPSQNISITNPTGLTVYKGMSKSSVLWWIDTIFTENDSSVSGSSELANPTWTKASVSRAPGNAVKQHAGIDVKKESAEVMLEASGYEKDLLAIIEKFKSAPSNSLTSRIATALTQVLQQENPGILAFAQLWFAIVRELRDKWETDQYLSGIDCSSSPDHRMCRLHQKLQMLQCCIAAKVKRHKLFEGTNSAEQSGDEYFDANEWLSEEDEAEVHPSDSCNKMSPALPRGRSRQLDIKLSEHPDIPVYEPFLQERCPMTEDMLENYTNYLVSLGSQESRNKAELESLRSDMQAFKAANPGCIFKDFIRWHSPRDLTKDESGIECLSSRMQGDDNIWVETWRDAPPQPVKYQKRLFNETKEAELARACLTFILQEFSSLTVSELVELLLPVVFKCAAKQLIKESSQSSHLLNQTFTDIFKKASLSTYSKEREMYLDVLREFYAMELKISQFSSLWTRFSDVAGDDMEDPVKADLVRDFTKKLLDASESSSKFGPLGGGEAAIRCMVPVQQNRQLDLPGIIMKKLFGTDVRLSKKQNSRELESRNWPAKKGCEVGPLPCKRRQYIFRCKASIPGSGSRLTPQRLYFSIPEEGQFRMGAAITEDIVLY